MAYKAITVLCAGLLLGSLFAFCAADDAEDLTDLRSASVVPDVLNSIDQSAGVRLNISYGSINFHTSTGRLTLAQTANAPSVHVMGGPNGALYSLALSDPDAPIPTNPSAREWLHWLVINAPGDDLGSGEVLYDYNAPAPPGGLHRYIFTLYSQPGGGNVTVAKPESRANFRAGRFGEGTLVPVNAAYFSAQAGF
ncbi:hypothetical protein WJX81_001699 [Elliptochloris bilobata]|uniref:Uncharacterized protein n=1 Tax=Elliptochloris bilobata TaxID=381761 RepID=A0AAW1S7W9_9CHLO